MYETKKRVIKKRESIAWGYQRELNKLSFWRVEVKYDRRAANVRGIFHDLPLDSRVSGKFTNTEKNAEDVQKK